MELDKKALADAAKELGFNCGDCGNGADGRCQQCLDLIARIVTAYENAYHPMIDSIEGLQALPVGSIVAYKGHVKYERDAKSKLIQKQWLTFGSRAEIDVADIPLPVRVVWKPLSD